jgi:PDZ domain-containing protein
VPVILNQKGERGLERRRAAASPTARLAVLSVLLAIFVVGAVLVPLPILTVHPGPTPDVSKLVTIDGSTYPSRGSFHMTTVTVRPATLVRAVAAMFNPEVSVIPREYVYTPGKSEKEIVQENAAEMDESGYAAAVAAYHEVGVLGPPEGALILATIEGTPASGVLHAGDVIVGLDGQPVTSNDALVGIVGRHKVGDELAIVFRRGAAQKQGTVRLVASTDPERKSAPVIGVSVMTKFTMPRAVHLNAGNIGGPSAGLIFSLSIVDRLEPEDLTRGYTIAGTGTIDGNGTVGPIDGVAQKVEAAERIHAKYFLAPRGNGDAAQARKAVDTDMKVIEVGTLHEAVAALEKLK